MHLIEIQQESEEGGANPHKCRNRDRLFHIQIEEYKHYRDIVLLNSAAALVVANKADNIEQGLQLAYNAIENKSALKILEKLVEYR